MKTLRHRLSRLPLSTCLLLGLPALLLVWLLIAAAPPIGLAVLLLSFWLLCPEAFRPAWWRRVFARTRR